MRFVAAHRPPANLDMLNSSRMVGNGVRSHNSTEDLAVPDAIKLTITVFSGAILTCEMIHVLVSVQSKCSLSRRKPRQSAEVTSSDRRPNSMSGAQNAVLFRCVRRNVHIVEHDVAIGVVEEGWETKEVGVSCCAMRKPIFVIFTCIFGHSEHDTGADSSK